MKNKSAWIPVTDKKRLPKRYKTVLVSIDGQSVRESFLADPGGWICPNSDYNSYGGVTHWQPMPEPAKP